MKTARSPCRSRATRRSTTTSTCSQEDLENGELKFGLPAALVILLLVFGAVVAGLVPLLMAIVAIVVALGLTALLAQQFELSVFVINMLTGMGLALGIDYSLFVVSRYREERAQGRHEPMRSKRREQPRVARSLQRQRSSSRCSGCCSSRTRSCAASRSERSSSGSSRWSPR